MVDADGFRPNVGIVLAHGGGTGQVLWARRVRGEDAWQFPQGGIHEGESPEDALYRELYEEVGLKPEHVKIRARTRGWLRYRLPRKLRRHNSTPGFVGQKQKWFLLEMLGSEDLVNFDCAEKPEFDAWRWVSFWYPLAMVIDFKREVYRRALLELAPSLPVYNTHSPASHKQSGHRRGSYKESNHKDGNQKGGNQNSGNQRSGGS